MKTSNKLLITFAAALILLPLLGMIVVSRVYYKAGPRVEADIVVVKSFDMKTEDFTNLPTSAFQTVNIPEAKAVRFNIHLVKDTKFGVKVSNHIKDRVSVTVDGSGQLQVSVKNEGGKGRTYGDLYIFSPNVSALAISNTDEVVFTINQDSLQLSVKEIESVYFENTKLKSLRATADHVNVFSMIAEEFGSVNLNLTNSSVISRAASYESLVINSSGKGDIEISGSEKNKEKVYTIKDLVINTTDEGKVSLGNITVDKYSGKFSDRTQVEMPASLLNKMYLKK